MGFKPWRVLLCLETLTDVFLHPDLNHKSARGKNKQPGKEIRNLQKLIESGKLVVYVPPTLVSVFHLLVTEEHGRKVAAKSVERLLSLANCDLDLDYSNVLRKANTVSQVKDDIYFYDLVCLTCADTLGVNCFIARNPKESRKIVDDNFAVFGDFSVHILDVRTAVKRMKLESANTGDRDIIHVLTPQYRLIELPRGATPIDFAYTIHTKVGDRCVKALIRGEEVPLNRPLQDGEVVEIVKGAEKLPDKEWLDFAITPLAKRNIQRALKQANIRKGWEIIKTQMEGRVRSYRRALADLAAKRHCSTDDFAAQVGGGELSIEDLRQLIDEFQAQQLEEQPSLISANSRWQLASCCNPLPGDAAIGVVVGNRPVRVHRLNCVNVKSLSDEKRLDITWDSDSYTIQLQITIKNVPDVIRAILNKLADCSVVSDFRGFVPISDGMARVTVVANKIGRGQLDRVMTEVQSFSNVQEIKVAKVVVN
jgi:TGS domain